MKPRHHVYLDEELTERLDALAAKPGSSKSAIVSDALKSYLGRRAARELDDLLKVRLDRFGSQLGRIERDQQVVMESLALFIRYQFMVTAPVPEADLPAARAAAQERFQSFIDQVGRRLAAGKRTAAEVVAKITPDGVVSTFAGLAGSPGSTDGTGSTARFYYPMGIALDNAGNVYVADFGNSTIRKITSAGVVSTIAGLASNRGSADGAGSTAIHLPRGYGSGQRRQRLYRRLGQDTGMRPAVPPRGLFQATYDNEWHSGALVLLAQGSGRHADQTTWRGWRPGRLPQ